jgi:hypothetical protein
MMSSAPEETLFNLDQQQPPPAEQEQICYVHCSYCDTILAVRTRVASDHSCPPSDPPPVVSSMKTKLMCCMHAGGRAVQQLVPDSHRAVRPLLQPALRQPPRPPAAGGGGQ